MMQFPLVQTVTSPLPGQPRFSEQTTFAWRPLAEFADASIAKLDNLRRADEAGLEVPETVWAWAAEISRSAEVPVPEALGTAPWIVRSGSPAEDTRKTSNAGQFESVEVLEPSELSHAVARVLASLPTENGQALGVVFVQKWVAAEVAGVTFFDGFYFEETRAAGSNRQLTGGRDRGDVRRGHLQRGDAHHAWLARVHQLIGGAVDIEWALPPGREQGQAVLLQLRPALFPIRRCETLSLANHKEIFGDPPSPWIVGVVRDLGGSVFSDFARAEPEVSDWHETYAIELGERAWLNLSPYFRLMDLWGLPRSMVTTGVGGQLARAPQAGLIAHRFWRKLPKLAAIGLLSFYTEALSARGICGLEAELGRCQTLQELQRWNVKAFAFSVRTNLAIMMVLSVASKLRRGLGLGEQAARVVTQPMMARYAALAALPRAEDRLRTLDRWLKRYGHRGPFESDPAQPRFCELRDTLRADLERGPAAETNHRERPPFWRSLIGRPLFWPDELREWFRDRLMRSWLLLRIRILTEARRLVSEGVLDQPDDAFFLRSEDLAADPSTWRRRVNRRRARWLHARDLNLPTTATRDEIEAELKRPHHLARAASTGHFEGIGLGHAVVSGTAVCAHDLPSLLEGKPLPPSPILIAPTLEPSWAVVFPRFNAVATELGGELSHAAILLREAGIPAVINAPGICAGIHDGDSLILDAARGEICLDHRLSD